MAESDRKPGADLLPCPFCGHDDALMNDRIHGWLVVACDHCGARGPFSATGWNSRALAQTQPFPLEMGDMREEDDAYYAARDALAQTQPAPEEGPAESALLRKAIRGLLAERSGAAALSNASLDALAALAATDPVQREREER